MDLIFLKLIGCPKANFESLSRKQLDSPDVNQCAFSIFFYPKDPGIFTDEFSTCAFLFYQRDVILPLSVLKLCQGCVVWQYDLMKKSAVPLIKNSKDCHKVLHHQHPDDFVFQKKGSTDNIFQDLTMLDGL